MVTLVSICDLKNSKNLLGKEINVSKLTIVRPPLGRMGSAHLNNSLNNF
jgi:hypothetical protein